MFILKLMYQSNIVVIWKKNKNPKLQSLQQRNTDGICISFQLCLIGWSVLE